MQQKVACEPDGTKKEAAPGRDGLKAAMAGLSLVSDGCSAADIYHVCCPWQEFEQLRVAAFHPMAPAMLMTPLLCVVAFTVVAL